MDGNESDNDMELEIPHVTKEMAWQSLQKVKQFYSSIENEEINQALNFVDKNLYTIMCNTSKQSKIIDFFK